MYPISHKEYHPSCHYRSRERVSKTVLPLSCFCLPQSNPQRSPSYQPLPHSLNHVSSGGSDSGRRLVSASITNPKTLNSMRSEWRGPRLCLWGDVRVPKKRIKEDLLRIPTRRRCGIAPEQKLNSNQIRWIEHIEKIKKKATSQVRRNFGSWNRMWHDQCVGQWHE